MAAVPRPWTTHCYECISLVVDAIVCGVYRHGECPGVTFDSVSRTVFSLCPLALFILGAIVSIYRIVTYREWPETHDTAMVMMTNPAGADYYAKTTEVAGINPTRGHYYVQCVVCHEANTGLLFRDCCHLCVCEVCGADLTRCPMCQTRITQPRLRMTRVASDL